MSHPRRISLRSRRLFASIRRIRRLLVELLEDSRVMAIRVAQNDTYTAVQNQDYPLIVGAPGVLANDSDADGDTLTVAQFTQPPHGEVSLIENGRFTYMPDPGYTGNDSFTYRVTDGADESNLATVTLNVLPVSLALHADYKSYTTPVNVPKSIAAPGLLPTGSPLTVLLGQEPAFGAVELNPDGSFVYTPKVGFIGNESFTYRTTDGQAASEPAAVTIQVTMSNDIAITNFFSDGVDLKVQYFVLGDYNELDDVEVRVYASPDGVALGQELASGTQNLGRGLQTLTITPHFPDLQQDYYLVAKVDTASAFSESNENNNSMKFRAGAFLVDDNGQAVLHVHGTNESDYVSVSTTSQASGWMVTLPQTFVAAPQGEFDFYDVTGNGTVSQVDADAVLQAVYGNTPQWQQFFVRWDVNGDSFVTAGDALAIINDYNAWGEHLLAGSPGPEDLRLDVTGDFVLSVHDANQVIDYMNGPGGGQISPAGRNAAQPFDTNGDSAVDYSDYQYIVDFLAASQTFYPAVALDLLPVRAHGGDDSIGVNDNDAPWSAVDPARIWLFGGGGNDGLSGAMLAVRLDGGSGNDSLIGSVANDQLYGGGGDDTLSGDNAALAWTGN